MRFAIDRSLSASRTLTSAFSVSALTGAPEAEISIGLSELARSAWGWFLERLPGRRYRKLLTRAIILDNEYRDLTRRANTVWMGLG